MKFIAKTSELKKAINVVAKALPSATTMSVMECIFIQAEDSVLAMTANNFEMTIKTVIPVVVQEEGIVCVNGKLLQKIVSANPDEEIQFITDENFQTRVKSKTMKFDLPGNSGSDFALPANIDKEKSILLQQEDFRDAIKKVAFCTQETINGNNGLTSTITLRVEDGKASFLATDGHRLAKRVVSLNYDNGITTTMMLPVKTVSNVASIIYDEGEMEINYTDNQCLFTIDNTTITTRLHNGKGVMDMPMPSSIVKACVEKNHLLNALTNGMLLSTPNYKTLVADIKKDDFHLSLCSTIGKWDSSVECKFLEVSNLQIGLDIRKFAEIIKAVDDENFIIQFTGDKNPVFIEGEDYIYILLPIILILHK